MEPRLKFKT